MSDADPTTRAESETIASETERLDPSPQPEGRFDWQVLLLRYLPEPRGTSHVVKRLAHR